MKKNLVFASRKHQTLPFKIGGLLFWSKRLTGEEELLMAEGSDATLTASEQLQQQAVRLVELLNNRLQDQAVQIDQAWALKFLGTSNTLALVQFWRTGQRPADFQNETFDLPEWGDPLLLGQGDDEREFAARATSFSEQIALAAAAPQDAQAGEPEPDDLAMVTTIAHCVTDLLNARLNRGGEMDTGWLLKQLQIVEVTQIMTYLASGEVPVEAEEADPNAEGAVTLSA